WRAQGDLWYIGVTSMGGAPMYDFLLTDAPYVTHVYVDQSTKRVVKIQADTAQPLQLAAPFPAISLVTSIGCPLYTLIEYLQPSTVVSGLFSTTPPSGYQRGQVPETASC